MNRRGAIGERIKLRLRSLRYWKNGRPDIARFCKEKGYHHQYVYAWLQGRVPSTENLKRLARDLQVSMAWILFGKEAAETTQVQATETTGRAPAPAGVRILEFTGLREATGQLVRLQAELEAILQGFPDLYFWLDSEGTILDYKAGPGSEPFIQPEMFLGKRTKDVLPAHVGDLIQNALHQAVQTNSLVSVEYALAVRDEERSYEARLLPLRGEAEGHRKVLTIVRDITERKRALAEAERRRREAEITAALAASISSSLDLDTVLHAVAKGARELCESDIAIIALRDARSEAMVFRYWVGARYEGDDTLRIEPGKGIGGQVLLTGRPFRTDHYAADPRLSPDYLAPALAEGIVAGMVVPIRSGDQVEGLLYVNNRSSRPFTDRDEEILLRLADHAASAMHNARLYGETERRRRTAERLAEVGRLISQSLDPEEVGQKIVESVSGLLGLESSALLRLEPESGDFRALAVSGELERDYGRNAVIPAGTGAAGVAVRERRPVVTPDVLADPRIGLTPEGRARAEQAVGRAVLAVPLLFKDRVIGALSVAGLTGRVFDAEEIRLAQSFADQAALALGNALLHKEVRDARDFLKAVAADSSDAAVAADRQGRITYINPRGEEIVGYRAAEILGRPVADYYRSGVAEARAVWRRLLTEGRITNYETAFRTRDGKWVEVSISMSLLRDTNEAIIGTLGVIRVARR